MDQINFSNEVLGANFAATSGDISLQGTFRRNVKTGEIVECNFTGDVAGSHPFTGVIDGARNITIYGLAPDTASAVMEAVVETLAAVEQHDPGGEPAVED